MSSHQIVLTHAERRYFANTVNRALRVVDGREEAIADVLRDALRLISRPTPTRFKPVDVPKPSGRLVGETAKAQPWGIT